MTVVSRRYAAASGSWLVARDGVFELLCYSKTNFDSSMTQGLIIVFSACRKMCDRWFL